MSYEVVTEELTAHASHLDGLTDRLSKAVDAAQTVSMSDEAYGILCSFLPPKVNPTEEEGINALKAAVEGVQATADNVRTTVTEYRDTDESNSASFEGFTRASTPATPLHRAETPLQATETPLHRAETPLQATETPLHRAETPLHTTQAPPDTTETPLHRMETPLHTTQAPLYRMETPPDVLRKEN